MSEAENCTGHYTDNGNGTVTDTRTGLMWMRCAMGQTWDGNTCQGKSKNYTWKKATKIHHTFAGYDDWRLPDIDELKTIIAISQGYLATIDNMAFPKTDRSGFWSSSPHDDDPYSAWYVYFSDGYVVYLHKDTNFKVRLVRDGRRLGSLNGSLLQSSPAEAMKLPNAPINHEGITSGAAIPAEHFGLEEAISLDDPSDSPVRVRTGHYTDNGNGTVTDTRTGLMWMRCAMGQTWDGNTCQGDVKQYPWREARLLLHTFAGYDDWRVPMIDELKTIIDIRQVHLTGAAIDNVVFPKTPLSYFCAFSQGVHFPYEPPMVVCFDIGHVYNGGSGYNSYAIRLVRGKQRLSPLPVFPDNDWWAPTLLSRSRQGRNEFQYLYEWLKGVMKSDTPIQVGLDELLQHFISVNLNRFGKREAAALAQLLANMGIGMEPDARIGNLLPKLGQEVILFKMSDNTQNSPSKEYSAATILVHLASVVANADGVVTPEEERYLERHLESWLHLLPDERIRLKAHTQWLLTSFPGLKGIKERLEDLNIAQKESIGKFLISVAQADSYIDATKIKILGKIYELLGLDAQNLYSHAHSAAVEPITVQVSDVVKQGYAIPTPPVMKPVEGFTLNMNSIEVKLAETVAVSALLNNIFTDDEPVTVQPTPVQKSIDSEVVPGLDAELYAFMRILAAKPVWSREELEKLAAQKGLMLDGTLDSINDASFDAFGEAFFEGDDPIEINTEIAKGIVP